MPSVIFVVVIHNHWFIQTKCISPFQIFWRLLAFKLLSIFKTKDHNTCVNKKNCMHGNLTKTINAKCWPKTDFRIFKKNFPPILPPVTHKMFPGYIFWIFKWLCKISNNFYNVKCHHPNLIFFSFAQMSGEKIVIVEIVVCQEL